MILHASPRLLQTLLAASLAALIYVADPVLAQTGKSLQVKTKLGTLEGKQTGLVRAYLGIPFAAPPVGPLRWREPMPAAKWKHVRQATEYGSRCMQPTLYADMVFRDPGISEDCLTLNIWTPAKNKSAKLPVMVWIYGGGFIAGTTSEARQDGAQLATNGVVVVTMNYRLGVFGYFAHPALTAESPNKASGNYGLLDQTAALRWVKENIAAFGGDSDNVTLFGESAGASSVSAQMASPLTKGLFQKAIGESGGAFNSSGLDFRPLKVVQTEDSAFAHEMFAADTLEQLRAIPAQQVLDISRKADAQGKVPRFGPDVDGYLLPDSIPAIFAAGRQNDVPLLAGYNRDEGGIDRKTTLASYQALVTARFGEDAPAVLKAYAAADDVEAIRAAADLAGDRFIAYSTWRWMEAQTKTGKQPVYRYRFDLAPPTDPNHMQSDVVYHSGEIPYVFGTLDLLHGYTWRPEDRTLSQQMQQYWTNFAKTGDPNGSGLPKWPVYTFTSDWQVMHLDTQPAAEKDVHRERDLMLDSIWSK